MENGTTMADCFSIEKLVALHNVKEHEKETVGQD